MNKRLAIIFLGIFFVLSFLYSQDYSNTVKTQAELMAQALMSDNYDVFINYTYPKVVQLLGGREKMLSILQEGKTQQKSQGIIAIKEVLVGDPGPVVKAGAELHCIIPEKITMELTNGKLIAKSNLLCISQDDGKNWHFVDCAMLNNDNIKLLFPDFNDSLKIPEPKMPEFIGK